jgi:hypothetical protein
MPSVHRAGGKAGTLSIGCGSRVGSRISTESTPIYPAVEALRSTPRVEHSMDPHQGTTETWSGSPAYFSN